MARATTYKLEWRSEEESLEREPVVGVVLRH